MPESSLGRTQRFPSGCVAFAGSIELPPYQQHASSPACGDVGTWGRGDVGTWGRGDVGTWGRCEVGEVVRLGGCEVGGHLDLF